MVSSLIYCFQVDLLLGLLNLGSLIIIGVLIMIALFSIVLFYDLFIKDNL